MGFYAVQSILVNFHGLIFQHNFSNHLKICSKKENTSALNKKMNQDQREEIHITHTSCSLNKSSHVKKTCLSMIHPHTFPSDCECLCFRFIFSWLSNHVVVFPPSTSSITNSHFYTVYTSAHSSIQILPSACPSINSCSHTHHESTVKEKGKDESDQRGGKQ